MFNLSGTEIIVILLLALVVLGPEKLPEALRRAGRTYAELKKMGNSFQTEMRSVLDEPMKEMRDTADLLRKAVDVTVTTATTDTRAATPAVEPAAPTTTVDDPQPAEPAVEPTEPTARADDPEPTSATDPAPVVAPNTPPMDAAPAALDPDDELINRTLSGDS